MKKFKEEQGRDNVKLEYLSLRFCHEDAHRVWCDVEANVEAFYRLKKLASC